VLVLFEGESTLEDVRHVQLVVTLVVRLVNTDFELVEELIVGDFLQLDLLKQALRLLSFLRENYFGRLEVPLQIHELAVLAG